MTDQTVDRIHSMIARLDEQALEEHPGALEAVHREIVAELDRLANLAGGDR